MQLKFSFIIPVYNRPQEIQELLESFLSLDTKLDYEIVIIEDGSTVSSKDIVSNFSKSLNIKYLSKTNSGPGDSRNYGMKKASGNYFIILDSDCILPKNYLLEVSTFLSNKYVDFFGGPDNAHKSFSVLQKAINYSMTSILTTGGIRGNKNSLSEFQPRSFNMGISKEAFLASNGFGRIHPGEDPDLTIRLWDLGFKSSLIPLAFVYHKRRISWQKFYQQVYKFGSVRPILNKWHPKTKKFTYWFPTFFIIGLVLAILLSVIGLNWLIQCYLFYYLLLFCLALISTKSLQVALNVMVAVNIQFYGYGVAFIKSIFKLSTNQQSAEELFPNLFFKIK